MNQRELAMKVAWSYLGKWYKWGGDDPSGFDCSGFVVETMKSVGLMGRKADATAAMLFMNTKEYIVPAALLGEGDLLFFGNDLPSTYPGTNPREVRVNGVRSEITHVEIAISRKFSIGASGGGSRTRTVDDAIRDNAFIKIRPINFDKLLFVTQPFSPNEVM